MRNLIFVCVLAWVGCFGSSTEYQPIPPNPKGDPPITEPPVMMPPAGPSWTVLNSGTRASLYGIWGASADEVYVVGEGGLILRSSDRGDNFSKLNSGTSATLFGVFGVNGAVYAFGYLGTLLRSIDKGDTWQPATGLSGAPTLFGMGGAAGSLYVVGEAGIVLHSTDGVSWAGVQSAGGKPLYGVWSTVNETFVVGDDGLFRTRDAGLGWTRISGVSNGRALWSSVSAELFVASFYSVNHTRDGGINWESLTSVTSNGHRGLIGFPEGDLWAVIQDGTILHYGNGYKDLRNAYQDKAPVSLHAIWGPAATDFYVVGDLGFIQRYR